MRVFAVRIGDYVEFRTANRPPRAKVSRLTRVFQKLTKVATPTPESPYYDYVDKLVETQVVLKTTFYIGGRVLGVTKLARYRAVSGAPKFGRRLLVEVTVGVKDAVLRG